MVLQPERIIKEKINNNRKSNFFFIGVLLSDINLIHHYTEFRNPDAIRRILDFGIAIIEYLSPRTSCAIRGRQRTQVTICDFGILILAY